MAPSLACLFIEACRGLRGREERLAWCLGVFVRVSDAVFRNDVESARQSATALEAYCAQTRVEIYERTGRASLLREARVATTEDPT